MRLLLGVAVAALALAPRAVGQEEEGADPDVTLARRRAASIPDPEKVAASAEAIGKMKEILKRVLGKLEEARNTKDVIKLTCVNEKLTQIKGLLRIAEQGDVGLQEALAKKTPGGPEHEFTRVAIAHSKVDRLGAEAEDCIGQLAFRTDGKLSLEVDEPNLPSGDPSNPPKPDVIISRPPRSSPTR